MVLHEGVLASLGRAIWICLDAIVVVAVEVAAEAAVMASYARWWDGIVC